MAETTDSLANDHREDILHRLKDELKNYLPEEVVTELLELDNDITELFAEAIVSHESENWSDAEDFYNNILNDSNISEEAREFVSDLKINVEDNISITEFLNEDEVEEQITDEEDANTKNGLDSLENTAADELYEKFQAGGSVSPRWNLAQEFKETYPNDSRLKEMMTAAARGYLSEGRYRHAQGEYDWALVYYNGILGESLVSDLHDQVQGYVDEIEQIQTNTAADELYEKFQAGGSVSPRWNLAQEFKETYPNDSRLKEMMTAAARGYLSEGRYRHAQGEYDWALVYYDAILNEKFASDFHGEVNKLAKQAREKKRIKTANEYYDDFNNAYYVSDRWSIAQEFKMMYPSDFRIKTIMTKSANENLHEGLRNKRANKSRAAIYYKRVIDEPYVADSTRHLAKIFNNQLSEHRKRIIYVDPGHGGRFSGAAHGGIIEKTLNLQVSNYLIRELESRGYLVMTSRTSDIHLDSNLDTDLTSRALEANGGDADIFISVHHNAGGRGKARGIETYIHHTVASGFGQELDHSNFKTNNARISESLRLAKSVQGNLIHDTGFNDRGVKGNNFNVLRNTYIPAILVELGYMDTPAELKIIKTPAYQKKAATAIAEGVDNYFKGI